MSCKLALIHLRVRQNIKVEDMFILQSACFFIIITLIDVFRSIRSELSSTDLMNYAVNCCFVLMN